MTAPAQTPLTEPSLWDRVADLLQEGQTLAARGIVLEAWRHRRHSVLADIIDALDVRLMRPLGQVPSSLDEQARKPPGKTFVFGHPWREWFTRAPDEVANRLAIFEEYPDPAATRVVLELLHVAPRQLLIAERLWSVVERVLIGNGDLRALPSLARFVDGRWPPQLEHLGIQSVPHLQSAIDLLKSLEREPPMEVPAGIEARLRAELAAVAACSEVSVLVPAEATGQLQRFVSAPDPAAGLLLADWLIDAGDPRGLLLNIDHDATAVPEVECVRVRAAQRWLSTAPHPVLALSVRSGLPWSVSVGVDLQRSPDASTASWPLWPLVASFTVDQWDDSFLAVTAQLGPLRELTRVPWSVARTLRIKELELLHIEAPGVGPDQLLAHCPQLREFVGVCVGALSPFDQLRSLSTLVLEMPVTQDRLLELASREVARRSVRTTWAEHRLTGRPGQLEMETTISPDWYAAFQPEDEDRFENEEERLFIALDELRHLAQAISQWRLAPESAESVPACRDWLGSRGLSP